MTSTFVSARAGQGKAPRDGEWLKKLLLHKHKLKLAGRRPLRDRDILLRSRTRSSSEEIVADEIAQSRGFSMKHLKARPRRSTCKRKRTSP